MQAIFRTDIVSNEARKKVKNYNNTYLRRVKPDRPTTLPIN